MFFRSEEKLPKKNKVNRKKAAEHAVEIAKVEDKCRENKILGDGKPEKMKKDE